MKRPAVLALALLLALSLCACGERPAEETGRVHLVATGFAPYDLAREVSGGLAEVSMLLSPGEETHTYDPSPADILRIRNSSVFVYGGGESDTWVDGVLSSLDTAPRTVRMMDCCAVLEEETPEGMQGAEEEEEESEYDEHVWTSPMNAARICRAICEALSEADPANAAQYRANTDAYVQQLEALDADFRRVTAAGRRDTLVFGDRFPLLYFVREYGLRYYAAFPGCASNTEPSAETVAFLVDKVREEDIPVVFKIELSNGQTAQVIADEAGNGAAVRTFYSCHNVARDDFQAGETYLSLMRKNLDTLEEALN